MNCFKICNFYGNCKTPFLALLFLFISNFSVAQSCLVEVTGDLDLCPGSSTTLTATSGFSTYSWSDNSSASTLSVTSAGVYCVTATDATGCTNFSCAEVTALESPITTLIEEICEGDVFLFEGNFYEDSGTYIETYPAANGCDSTVVLNLTVNEAQIADLVTTICEGESLIVGDSVYTEAGFYINLFISSIGCDSLVFVDLSVSGGADSEVSATICEGESYEVGTSSYTQSGTYIDMLTTEAGCDSTVTLNLTVLDSPERFLSEVICDGESVELGGVTYSETGTYEAVFTAANGCDSTVTLNLVVTPTFFIDLEETICAGDSYSVGAESFTETGMYLVELLTENGCDSTVSLDLTVLPVFEESLEAFICPGSDIDIGDQSFSTTGNFQVVLTASNGCDSTINLDLTVLETFETDASDFICPGTPYEIGGMTFTEEGTYPVTLVASNGCDSMVNLTLTFGETFETSTTAEFCPGGTYELGGMVFTEAGEYQVTLAASNGCDSLVNLTLEETTMLTSDVNLSICDGQSVIVAGMEFDEVGNYEVMAISQFGCDSLINLTLIEGQSYSSEIETSICEGEVVTIGTESFTESGNYEVILTNASGCDSLVRLDLTVFETTETNLSAAICAGESVTIAGQEFSESGTFAVEQIDDNGCTNITNLTLEVYPTSSTYEDVLCSGESVEINGTIYDENNPSGTEIIPDGSMAFDCDSTIIVSLTFIPAIEVTDTVITADNGTGNGSISPTITGGMGELEYEWSTGATTLTIDQLTTGNYTLVVTDENGCVEIFTFFVDVETSLEEELANEVGISVYPNPADEVVFIELENAKVGEKRLYLYELTGRLVEQFTFESNQLKIDLPLQAGTYIYQLETAEGLKFGKIIRK